MTPHWAVLVAEVPDRLEDEVAAALGQGSLGVELVPAGPATTEIRVFWPAVDGREPPTADAARILEAFGIHAPVRVEPVEDGRWVERYQAALRPMPLGERFLVVAGDTLAEPGPRTAVRIVPGMAFGTGEHPTTRQCAARLEQVVASGSSWLDLGTGSGVLAIVARLSGATRVVGVDVDPAAVAVAREGFLANGVSDAVEAREGSIDEFAGAGFDGIVANIASSFFLRNASAVASALRPAGLLVASGFLVEDVPDIDRALAAAGLTTESTGSEGPWAVLTARRTGPG